MKIRVNEAKKCVSDVCVCCSRLLDFPNSDHLAGQRLQYAAWSPTSTSLVRVSRPASLFSRLFLSKITQKRSGRICMEISAYVHIDFTTQWLDFGHSIPWRSGSTKEA